MNLIFIKITLFEIDKKSVFFQFFQYLSNIINVSLALIFNINKELFININNNFNFFSKDFINIILQFSWYIK